MGEYKRSGGRERKPAGRFGRRDSDRSGSRDSGRFEHDSRSNRRSELTMHDVVCDKCGKETTVPFKPTSNKPVYCRDCFNKKNDSFTKPRPESRDISNYSADELAKINQKLDKIIRALNLE